MYSYFFCFVSCILWRIGKHTKIQQVKVNLTPLPRVKGVSCVNLPRRPHCHNRASYIQQYIDYCCTHEYYCTEIPVCKHYRTFSAAVVSGAAATPALFFCFFFLKGAKVAPSSFPSAELPATPPTPPPATSLVSAALAARDCSPFDRGRATPPFELEASPASRAAFEAPPATPAPAPALDAAPPPAATTAPAASAATDAAESGAAAAVPVVSGTLSGLVVPPGGFVRVGGFLAFGPKPAAFADDVL